METIAVAGVERYLAVLAQDPVEREALARSLLVCATSFFRNRAVFEALEQVVVPSLLDTSASVRAWCVGVATGEEAYSVAFTIARCARQTGSAWRVLATDRNPSLLEGARRGAFSAVDVSCVPPELLATFFREDCGTFTVLDAIRDRIDFEEHDFMGPVVAPKRAVVARFDLVLMRNVLLYMDGRLRDLAAERLASVVRPGGAVLIGVDERLPDAVDGQLSVFPGTGELLRIFRRS
jgi:chemotaxis methyl-accepting protein methylase